MRRDMHVVLPDTSVEDVIRMIDSNDIRRVAVVDAADQFLGLISDRDLLTAFSNDNKWILDFFVTHIPFTERAKQHRNITTHLQTRTAGEVMKTDLITGQEDTPLDEALTRVDREMSGGVDTQGVSWPRRRVISREHHLFLGLSSLHFPIEQAPVAVLISSILRAPS